MSVSEPEPTVWRFAHFVLGLEEARRPVVRRASVMKMPLRSNELTDSPRSANRRRHPDAVDLAGFCGLAPSTGIVGIRSNGPDALLVR